MFVAVFDLFFEFLELKLLYILCGHGFYFIVPVFAICQVPVPLWFKGLDTLLLYDY